MMTRLVETFSTLIGPALANHLWQSTLFAVAAALLTLVLRRNAARYRYWVWLAASVKFLIPLSVLMSLGGQLAGAHQGATLIQPAPYYAMDVASQPFTFSPAVPRAMLSAKGTTYVDLAMRGLPVALVAVWVVGVAVVLGFWWKRWRTVAAAQREASLAVGGREFEALRKIQPPGVRLRLAISKEALEPGVFGVIDPVLVWPAAFSEHLDDAQMEAILAHEVCHVKRRDNLAAALHMVIEAVFWFHPMVWWLGRWLVEERERACDEAVVELGSEPQVYAESILKACTFCVESPLACVAGITGADLKARVVRIMTEGVAERLSVGRRLLIVVVGLSAVAGPVLFGLADTPRLSAEMLKAAPGQVLPTFEVATVKPNTSGDWQRSLSTNMGKLEMKNIPLRDIISYAYDLKSHAQVTGAPSWVDKDPFDIMAKPDEAETAALQKMPRYERNQQMKLMLQALLIERFGLKVSRQTKELPVYALVVAKGGTKLTPAPAPVPADATAPKSPGHLSLIVADSNAEMTATAQSLDGLASALSDQVETGNRPVVDKTGLAGEYNWTLKWTPLNDKPTDDAGPSLFTALEEQLGLKLEAQKGLVDVLVVEEVSRPSAN